MPADAGLQEFRRNWPMLVPSMAGIMLCSINGYSLGVMMAPLEREFGWSRAEISSGMMIVSLIALLAAPAVGLAVDRIGPRRIAIFGVVLFCSALAMLSTATPNILSWWALWVFLAIGNMFVLPTVWTTAINGLFHRHRGKALAVALCGTGVAAAFVPSLVNALVDKWGWRGAYVGLAGIFAAVVLPLVVLFFRGAADGARGPVGHPGMQEGVEARDGLRSPPFLKLAGAALLFSVTICALTTTAVPVLLGEGFDAATAAATAGLLGIGSIIGRLGGGVLLDRFNASRVAACSVIAPVITVSILLATENSVTGASIAFFILGLAVGTEVDACAYLAARHFGLKSFGTLFGTVNGLLLFGNGLAPLAAGFVYDVTGTYAIVLWTQIPACLGAAVLFLAMGPYPQPEPVAGADIDELAEVEPEAAAVLG